MMGSIELGSCEIRRLTDPGLRRTFILFCAREHDTNFVNASPTATKLLTKRATLKQSFTDSQFFTDSWTPIYWRSNTFLITSLYSLNYYRINKPNFWLKS